ncbi:MAG: hypothetical protein KDJ26_04000 [Alphaproteobacteria bacterium]|nr:hypothetical protein [Alphaproteobacteria bacterium]MCB9984112.1 hypothetical protein [Micavibrio sp.]
MNTLQQARTLIDEADKKMASIVAKFNIVSDPESSNAYEREHTLASPARETLILAKVPTDIFNKVVKLFELSERDAQETRIQLRGLAVLLIERFSALEAIVTEKVNMGLESSFDPKRHQDVVNRGAAWVGAAGGNPELGRCVFRTIADEFVEAQNQYLEDQTGAIAEYIRHRENNKSGGRRPGW